MATRSTRRHGVDASSTSDQSEPGESTTRIKRADPQADETREAIFASLDAALRDLDQLEHGKQAPSSTRIKLPRGMPPLPGGRMMPPLPVRLRESLAPLRRSLAPRKESLAPRPPAAAAMQNERPAPRWPAYVAAVLGVVLLSAAAWLSWVGPRLPW
jgi:hypothetical protein